MGADKAAPWPDIHLREPKMSPNLHRMSWGLPARLDEWPSPYSSHAGISFILFHHIRAVFTITDTIPAPCENHSPIVRAKRVSASRGGRVFHVKSKRSFIVDSPERGLTI